MGSSIHLKNSYSGFTLTELVVVIGILGVLAASIIAVIDPLAQFRKANDAKRKTEISEIKTALEFFKIDVGSYPDTNQYPTSCGGQLTNPSSPSTIYIRSLPCSKGVMYIYTRTSPTTYTLKACLENQFDPDKDTTNTCTSGTYSYTVYNP